MKKTLSLLAAVAASTFQSFGAGHEVSIAQTAASIPDAFSTLTLALVKTDLTETLNNKGDFTVFAPTNEAFDAAATSMGYADGPALILDLDKETLADILLYHVVPGNLLSGDVLAAGTLTTANGDDITIDAGIPAIIDGQLGMAGFVALDVPAANGTIHIIDSVLLPPVTMDPVSIYETAAMTPALSSLVAAIDKAGLKSILSSDSWSLTVFAPTNDAFDEAARAALNNPAATGADLVNALSSWQLRRILLNHVLWGELDSNDVLARDSFFTFAWGRLHRIGTTLTSRNGEGDLILDLIDIEATNGIVHVIDGVLLP